MISQDYNAISVIMKRTILL